MKKTSRTAKRPRRKKGARARDLPHIIGDLQWLAVPLDNLTIDPENARKHDDANVAAIAASLARYGQRTPIVANCKTATIEKGNGTYLAARKLGWTHLAAIWVEDDPDTARGYSIADNRTAELADWDLELLLSQTEEMPAGLHGALGLDVLLMDRKSKEGQDSEPDGSQQIGNLEYRIIIVCQGESHQAELLARLEKEGLECQALIS